MKNWRLLFGKQNHTPEFINVFKDLKNGSHGAWTQLSGDDSAHLRIPGFSEKLLSKTPCRNTICVSQKTFKFRVKILQNLHFYNIVSLNVKFKVSVYFHRLLLVSGVIFLNHFRHRNTIFHYHIGFTYSRIQTHSIIGVSDTQSQSYFR